VYSFLKKEVNMKKVGVADESLKSRDLILFQLEIGFKTHCINSLSSNLRIIV
jgi:hypothetical protein